MAKIGLTIKQKAFADEYIINGGNATQAAIKAGYSKKTAEAIGFENLKKPKITEYIASKVKDTLKCREIDIQEQLNTLLDIYHGKTVISHSKQIDHLSGDEVVKDMTYEYTPDLEARLKAFDTFMKYASPLLKAQTRKADAEARILTNKADKLTNDSKTNEVLEAFLDVIGGVDDD